MGSVYNRGTKDDPNWYIRFRDHDGKWKSSPSDRKTKTDARRRVDEVDERIKKGLPAFDDPEATPLVSGLLDKWIAGLTNRNARDDKTRMERHLKSEFGEKQLADVNLRAILEWLDRERARKPKPLSDASLRQNLNLLSRFFSWAVERGHAEINPVRQIPTGKRPHQAAKSDTPWLDDDATVRKLIAKLRKPVDLIFYLGNRSGLRLGEACGLRLSDLGFLDENVIRVRFSYLGPLKEDKYNTGKLKWVPAPADAAALLAPVIASRTAEGAGPEDLVFPNSHTEDGCFRKLFIERAWHEAIEALKLDLTFYQATRHSFVSRNLSRGASLDEVSSAIGHSSPMVTKRYYDHFVRKQFSVGLREGLGLGGDGHAKVIPIAKKKGKKKAAGSSAG